jgi:2-amino-4-hydroxy-6-hydroxymethyldihydropteridine diphosphokinase
MTEFMLNRAYLSLGSNVEPEFNLVEAARMLAAKTKLVVASSVWETTPLGSTRQPNYLNAAAIVDTELTVVQLKHDLIAEIERGLGRVRQLDKFAPRPIDIDIMLFNRQLFTLDKRQIPDPEVLERSFVAIPLAEIAPDYIHPETGQTLQQIARGFQPKETDMWLRPDLSQSLQQLSSLQFKKV